MSFSNLPRFHDPTAPKVLETPGPGYYNTIRKDKNKAVKLGTTKRFTSPKTTKIGPGYYNTPAAKGTFASTLGTAIKKAQQTMGRDARNKLEEIAKAWKAERAMFEDLITSLRDNLEATETALDENSLEKEQLENDVERLEKDCSEWKASCEQEMVQSEEHQAKCAKLETEIADKQKNITTLQAQMVQLTGDKESLTAKIDAAESQIQEQSASYNEICAKFEASTKEVEEHVSKIATLSTELSQASDKIDTLTEEQAQLMKHKADLKQAVQDGEIAFSNLKAQHEETTELAANLREELDTKIQKFNGNLAAIENALAQKAAELATEIESKAITEAKLEETMDALATASDLAQQHSEEISQLKEQVTSINCELDATKNSLGEQIERGQKAIQELETDLDATRAELSQTKSTLLQKVEEHRMAENQLQETSLSLKDKTQTAFNLEAKIKSLNMMLDTTKADLEDANTTIQESNETIANMEDTMESKEKIGKPKSKSIPIKSVVFRRNFRVFKPPFRSSARHLMRSQPPSSRLKPPRRTWKNS
mmetsp:Transcript_4537/g.8657  ORF Transcript_4537/g.8657 Transcript_4537/m.8657 type:complete len:540 (+) Transcript_4537:131-1750(+)